MKLNRRLTEMVRDVELPPAREELDRAPYDRGTLDVVLEALEFRNPNFRERLLRGRPRRRARTEVAPAGRGGRDRRARCSEPASCRPGWPQHGADSRWGWPRRHAGRWAPARVTEVALAATAGPAAWFDPAQLDEADERAFAAWLADPEPAQGAAQRQAA